MAVAVLENYTAHTAISDAESILYILIWIACLYAGPRGTKRPETDAFSFKSSFLSKWCPEGRVDDDDLRDIGLRKRGLLLLPDVFQRDIVTKIHEYFAPIANCLKVLRAFFFRPEVDVNPTDLLLYGTTNVKDFGLLKNILKTTMAQMQQTEPVDAPNMVKQSLESATTREQEDEMQKKRFVEDKLPPLRI